MTDQLVSPTLSADFFARIIDTLPAAVVVVDAKHRIAYANAVFTILISAWPASDEAGAADDYMAVAQRTFAASDPSALSSAIDMITLGVTLVDLTYAYVLRNEAHTLALTLQPIVLDGVTSVLIHHMPIMDHVQSGSLDSQVGQQHDLAMHMLNAAGEGILTLDIRGRISFINSAAQAMLGWSQEELHGQPYTTIVDDSTPAAPRQSDSAGTMTPIQAALKLGQTSRLDTYAFKLKAGTMMPVEFTCAPLRTDQDDSMGVVITFRDITRRKKAEAEQRRLIAILDASTDMVSIANMDGQPLYLNPAGRRMMGFSADAAIEQTIIADYHPEWALKKVMEEGIPTAIRDGWWSGETAIRGSGGQEIPLSQVILAHRDSNGELEFLSTVARNISMMKQSETMLRITMSQEAQIKAHTALMAELSTSLLQVGAQRWLLPLIGHFSPERIQQLAATLDTTLHGTKPVWLIVDLSTHQQFDESLRTALRQILAHVDSATLCLIGNVARDAVQAADLSLDGCPVYDQLADALHMVLAATDLPSPPAPLP